MANTTFDGPVRSKNGFINLGPSAVKAETSYRLNCCTRRKTCNDGPNGYQPITMQSFQLLILLLQDQEVIQITQTQLVQLLKFFH